MREPARAIAIAAAAALFAARLAAAEEGSGGAAAAPDAATTSPAADPCPRPLSARPGGPLIGCLEESAEYTVRERSGGWTRIWLEVWVPQGPAAALASLSVEIAGPDSLPAAGARVRLLEPGPELEDGLAALRRRHAAARAEIGRRQAEVERALERVLFSSDNLTQATESRRRLRAEKEALEQERRALSAASRAEAAALIDRRQARAGSCDAAGRLEIEGLTPGTYLLLVGPGVSGSSDPWWMLVTLAAGERRRLEVTASPPRESPFADLD